MRFRGVLFDLDDTLTDRRACLEKAAVVFARRFAEQLVPCEPRFIARTMRETEGGGYRPRVEFFGDLIDRLAWREAPDVGSLADFWEGSFPECSALREGASAMLESLLERNLRVGVVTNGATAIQQRKIDALGIRHLLGSVVVSEAVGQRKPDSRIFEIALESLGLTAAECVFVGDHPVNDVVGSREAGLTAVWLTGMHPWPEGTRKPELRISRLPELDPILGTWNR